MRLRLNIPQQFLAYHFKVCSQTIRNTFMHTVTVMYAKLSPLINWPDRESLWKTMPHQFVETFGKCVAIIIDCFEVFIERPANLTARAQTFSNYKHNPEKIDLYMTNLLAVKISKVLAITWNLDLIYDDDVRLFGKDGESPALQVKSLVGVGLLVRF